MAKRRTSLLGLGQPISTIQRSLKIIDVNTSLQEPQTQMEPSEVNVSFVCGTQCSANGDIAYHKEYLDELYLTLVAI